MSSRFFRALLVACALAGCGAPTRSGPLPQRGYLWQRAWNPAVTEAVHAAEGRLGGLVVLGGELRVSGGKPVLSEANLDWAALHDARLPLALALRVAPYSGPFSTDDPMGRKLLETARSLLAQACAHGVPITEFQLDFDCATRSLEGYAAWLRALRSAVHPVPLVITALPAWLDRPAFRALLRETDGYVLQVHSVPTQRETGRASLCDPALARRWVAQAAALGRPFSVALPTYRCVAGYDPAGHLLSVAMDSVPPTWPPGTRTLDFATDAAAVAGLVREWQEVRPALLRELIWYRVPVSRDRLNWTWPTLAAVMAGRAPSRRLEIVHTGENPIDLALRNAGEDDAPLDCRAAVAAETPPTACDALAGWTVARAAGETIFAPGSSPGARLRPGEQRVIGWLRYEQTPSLRFDLRENR